jgi:hypothetical protein
MPLKRLQDILGRRSDHLYNGMLARLWENRTVSNHPRNASTATLVACAFTVAFVTPALRADDESSAQLAKSKTKAPAETENETIAAWRTDLAAFESYLKRLAPAARMPTEEDFKERDAQERDWKVITDGGGVIDFKPGEDTVQFRVNEALKGKTVRWEFELGRDAGYGEQVGLTPPGVPEAVTEGKDIPILTTILFKRHQAKLPPRNSEKDNVPHGQGNHVPR